MSFTAKFTLADMEKYILQQTELGAKAVLDTFKFAGEGFVRDARLNGDYNDITGNLRSSIGYIIMNNGKQVDLNFGEAGKGTDQITGVAIGIDFAEQIAELYPKGLALICVAGMDYAAAVESKGRDVITGSTQELQDRLRTLLSEL
jgi:hypothetical protein